MEKIQNNSFLVQDKLSSLMQKYAVPNIISLLVAALYNIVDQIFIANADYLGSYGNAANSAVYPLTVVALAIAMMIGDGCCTFASINLGAQKHDKAASGVANALMALAASGIALTLIYLLFGSALVSAFGGRVNEETFRLAKEYFFYISLGIPFYMFSQAMSPIIRSDGSPNYAMGMLVVGALINIVLDPIFIFIFKWGMMGAAVATILGQIVSAVMAFVYLFKMKTIRLSEKIFKFRARTLKRILQLGAASFLAQISIVISMAAVLNMAAKYSASDPIFSREEYAQIPTAVIGIVMKFFQIVISIAVGLSAGCIPIVGYNTGANRKDRVRALMRLLLAWEAAIGFVFTVIFELFPHQLIGIFGAANESVYYTDFAVKCIRIFLCMMTLSCFNKGAFIFLQALGKVKESTALSMIREIVFGAGLPILLPIFFGLDGILYFMPIADILTAVITVIIMLKTDKALKI